MNGLRASIPVSIIIDNDQPPGMTLSQNLVGMPFTSTNQSE